MLLHFLTHVGSGISSLPPEVRGDLKQQLELRLMEITTSFAFYSSCVPACLERKHVDVETVCAFLLSLPSFTCEQESGNQSLMLLSQKRAKLEKATSIHQIFKILNSECVSFLNYSILEALIQKFELELDEKYSKYPEKLQNYIKKHKISSQTHIE